MTDHTYRVIELAGSSETSHADAIENAIARASKTTRNLRWFEVTQMRGEIEDGKIRHYQVTMKVGFTLEDWLRSASVARGDLEQRNSLNPPPPRRIGAAGEGSDAITDR